MFIAATERHLFYASGKIGTQTLVSIPGITKLHPVGGTIMPKLRKRTLSSAVKYLGQHPYTKLTVIVREPNERFRRGLFEIVAKQSNDFWITHFINQQRSTEFVETFIKTFECEQFWIDAIQRILALAPYNWEPETEFPSRRWQYHIGNWLTDAEYLINSFGATVVDIKNLSSYLTAEGYSYRIDNTYKSFLSELLTPSPKPYCDIAVPHDSILAAFESAYTQLPVTQTQKIQAYLQAEIETYNRISKYF